MNRALQLRRSIGHDPQASDVAIVKLTASVLLAGRRWCLMKTNFNVYCSHSTFVLSMLIRSCPKLRVARQNPGEILAIIVLVTSFSRTPPTWSLPGICCSVRETSSSLPPLPLFLDTVSFALWRATSLPNRSVKRGGELCEKKTANDACMYVCMYVCAWRCWQPPARPALALRWFPWSQAERERASVQHNQSSAQYK